LWSAHDPTLLFGAGLLALLALAAIAAPILAPHSPLETNLGHRLEAPSPGHPLGRDDLGRDVLSRLLWGARTSLPAAALVVALSAATGTLLGALAGLVGGRVDLALMAIADLLLAFPGILLAITVVAARGPGFLNVIAALSLLGWVGFARLARGEALRIGRREFVEAARSAGAGRGRLLIRHIAPLLAGPVLVQAAFALGGVVLAEAGLSFLGIGVPPPAPTWGGMLRDACQNLLDAPRLAIAPGLAIALTVLGAQCLASGLQPGGASAAGAGAGRLDREGRLRAGAGP
jgi:peptide/nickel transport system permease protein